MYHNQGCLGSLGAGSAAARYDLDAEFERLQFELRNEERPSLYFWTAHDLGESLLDYLKNAPFPGLYDASTNSWNTTPAVNMLVDINTTMAEIDAQLKKAKDAGWIVVQNSRTEQYMQELLGYIAHIKQIYDAIWLAVQNSNAAALAEAQRKAEAMGGSREGWDLFEFNINKTFEVMKEKAKETGQDLINQANKIDWSGIAKVAMPVAVVGLLGWMMIRKL